MTEQGRALEGLDDAKECIEVHVRGGVAYCEDDRVKIIDHDNLEEETQG